MVMSYAAASLQQEIARRLKGECRVSLISGNALAFSGERLTEFTSCANCTAPCEDANASGLLGEMLEFTAEMRRGVAHLEWACPSCGHKTHEESNLLNAPRLAREIESDPLCFSCRKRMNRLPA